MTRQEILRFKPARRIDVMQEIFKSCDEMITLSQLRDAVELARVGIALAARWGNSCLESRSFAVLGSIHRGHGDYQAAARAYNVAEKRDQCQYCLSDLSRRRAFLDFVMGKAQQALVRCDDALRIYRAEGDENLLGKTLILRSALSFYDQRYSEALYDIKQAILLLNPKESFARLCAIHNLCALLAASNNLSHVNQACVLLSKLKERLKGTRGLTLERAKLQWTEGLLAARLLSTPRAVYLLESAQRKLIALGAAHDVAAITADLARLRCEDGWGVARALCRNTLTDARELLEPEHARLLREIGAHESDPLPLLEELRTNLPRPSVAQMPLPVG